MKIIYISDDGIQFDNETDCQFHEWKMQHNHLKNIKFYNGEGKLLTSSPLEEEHYSSVETVVISNEEELKDLQALTDYTGFCAYESINKMGTWKYCVSEFILIKE